MAEFVCPWWLGYALASPLRRIAQDPAGILYPYVRRGMVVLEPGPGMGFFTQELAWMVGAEGKVIAVDLQAKMLKALKARLERAGLGERIETRVVTPESLGTADLAGTVDFALAFAMVHEVPDQQRFLGEIYAALKPEGRLLLSEPRVHVSKRAFEATLDRAQIAGFTVAERPKIRWSLSAVLQKG